MDIKAIVSKLVRTHRTRNPFEMIQGMNVILIFYPLKEIKGFYQYFQRNNIIYIDEQLPEHEKEFVCAHELGHMLLHRKSNAIFMDSRTNFNVAKYEIEANRFAVELLIPDDEFLQHSNCTIQQLSRIYGYQQKLIELKLRGL